MDRIKVLLPLLVLLFQSCRTVVTYTTGSSIDINEATEADSSISKWLQPLSDSLNAQMNEIIGFTPQEFRPIRSKGRISQLEQHKATLARLVADYTLEWSRNFAQNNNLPLPEIAVLNHNGLRNSIDSGTIVLGNVYEVMPFDNEVVLLVLSGTQMIELFDFIAQIGGSPFSGGILYLDTQKFTKAEISGNMFDSRRSYCIATVDFMLGGGDGFTMLKDAKRIIQTGTFLRDVIINGVRHETKEFNGQLRPRNNPRIYHQ